MIQVTTDPIDGADLLRRFSAGRPQSGAIASFIGLVRGASDGDPVTGLALQAYPGFTEGVMADIEAEARSRFAVEDVLIVHRWGEMGVGDAVIFVAAAAAHRRPALEAVDFLMDQIKLRAPFWKKERRPDGDRWIEPRDQDHGDARRWINSNE